MKLLPNIGTRLYVLLKTNYLQMKTFKNLIVLLLFIPYFSFSQGYKDPKAPIEERVKDLLSKMTIEEKIDYLGGVDGYYIRALPRLGLPAVKMSDGPVGSRNDGQSTAYPAGALAAATWDLSLVKQMGEALGSDCRARGVHILLAPGVNIYRAPMCGRNFEYFGEDPYLSGRLAVNYIKGIQSQGVSACVKHFAGNDEEWDRNRVSSDIDERTLQEIYLPAFKAAVMEGKVGTVMNSYNLLNGEHSTQNSHLNNDILKGQWGFDGILMSDWGATYDGVAAAKGGLDLEMGSGDYMNRKSLLPALQNGTISESLINDKVSRILRLIFRFGFYDRPQQEKNIPLDNPASAKVALNLARAGIVLLKNEDNVLPLDKSKIKTLAVIGPNADQYIFGGGSSQTVPFHSVTPLQGIKDLVGDKVQVNCVSSTNNIPDMIKNAVFYTEPGSEEKGLKAEYFDNISLSGTPAYTRVDPKVDFNWQLGAPNIDVQNFPVDNFSIRWTGVIRPEDSSIYTFVAKGDDGFRLWIDNKLIIDDWKDQATTQKTATISLEKGKEYAVKLEYFDHTGLSEIHLGWGDDCKSLDEATKVASSADAAIVFVGFNGEYEQEGQDRPFELPVGQNELINAVAKANPNTIVVINAGGNVYMQPWLQNVKGLLHAWYAGQEGGTALSEILFGKVNPSGKLPDTFEKRWEDNPTHDNYYDPQGTLKVKYKEGLLVGYRYYDTKQVEPQFPFGFGLSYTTFAYSDLKVIPHTVKGKPGYVVSFDIQNTGNRVGAESAQVYVKAMHPSVMMPEKELKGFTKVSLNAGEKKRVSVVLDSNAFSYYNTDLKKFVVDKGAYQIIVGASSRDLKLKGKVTVN
jgi:beta-glucosidase